MRGLTGVIKFDHQGFRSDFALDITELSREGLKKIGTWNSTEGVNFTRSYGEVLTQIVEIIQNKTFIVTTILVSNLNKIFFRVLCKIIYNSLLGKNPISLKHQMAAGNARFPFIKYKRLNNKINLCENNKRTTQLYCSLNPHRIVSFGIAFPKYPSGIRPSANSKIENEICNCSCGNSL